MTLKFRKKPVVIEAVQLLGTRSSIIECLTFMGQTPNLSLRIADDKFDEYCFYVEKEGLIISTLEGDMRASVGDFIIKGVQGEFYPCKPDIFMQTYEPCD